MPRRHSILAELEPVAGDRFQPTGFPDLGAATFKKPKKNTNEWVDCLLVESEQSMANHLESVGWDRGNERPHETLNGLPYVRVETTDGEYLTSSRTEAHRLSSAFIREATVDGQDAVEFLKQRLGLKEDRPLSSRTIASAILGLDPLCLVHGVFFADKELPGQPKITRALTSFVEAIDVQRAEFGGVKKDDVRHKKDESGGSGEGYGSIPFHRTFWTARTIRASFVLDLSQLASFGLRSDATRLLEVLALWEVASLLDNGLRLRASCDLAVSSVTGDLPSVGELASEIRALSSTLEGELNRGRPLNVVWSGGKKARTNPPAPDGKGGAEE